MLTMHNAHIVLSDIRPANSQNVNASILKTGYAFFFFFSNNNIISVVVSSVGKKKNLSSARGKIESAEVNRANDLTRVREITISIGN